MPLAITNKSGRSKIQDGTPEKPFVTARFPDPGETMTRRFLFFLFFKKRKEKKEGEKKGKEASSSQQLHRTSLW